MATKPARIRAMSKQRKSQIEAYLRVKNIINEKVDQRILYFNVDKTCRSRKLKTVDKQNKAKVEWCSAPWFGIVKQEWICSALFDDEELPLDVNPLHIMAHCEFYRTGINNLLNSQVKVRRFLQHYIQSLDNDEKSNETMNEKIPDISISLSYLKKLFQIRTKTCVKRNLPQNTHRSRSTQLGLFIPKELFQNELVPFLKKQGIKMISKKKEINFLVTKSFISAHVFENLLIRKYGDGSVCELICSSPVLVIFVQETQTLIIPEISYRNKNRWQREHSSKN